MEVCKSQPQPQPPAMKISALPQEIVEEILLRVPLKSLVRFRCVSKPWRSLIGSNHFIKKHLQKSKGKRRVLLASHRATLSQCSLLSLFKIPRLHALESNFPTDLTINTISLVGSCNGLVCILLNRKELILWNPSTRISKKLPPTSGTSNMRYRDSACYGFGYDESSDDYKVFLSVRSGYKCVCKLYSLKTNSWKKTNVWDASVRCCGKGKLASGKLHWVGTYTQVVNSSRARSDTEEEEEEEEEEISDTELEGNRSDNYDSFASDNEKEGSDDSDDDSYFIVDDRYSSCGSDSDSYGSDNNSDGSDNDSFGSDNEEEGSSGESSDSGVGRITGPGFKWDIVAFDISREVYDTVEQPCYSEGRFKASLGNIGEYVSVLCLYKYWIDVWVMKRYGVKESWRNVITIDDEKVHCEPRKCPPLTPFHIGRGGVILVMQKGRFSIWDEDEGFQPAGNHELYSSSYEADIYVESLVSLSCGDEVEEEQGNGKT